MHSSLPAQLTSFRFSDSKLLIRAFEWLEQLVLSRADAVITICPALAEYALAQGVPADRHFLIENSLLERVRLLGGPEEQQAAPSIPEPPEGAEVVIYAGTLEAYQGIDLLLEAVARLAARRPALFLLVLGGSSEQVARYEARAASLGLGERCRFAGRVPQECARACIARARVQTSTRIAGTNTPLKVYEQLASGVALLATDIPSHTQVLDDGVALLVAPEPAAVADGLERLLDDAPLRAALGARAKRLYAERYSREQYFARMRALLEAVD
jgi:glycosyltransferase involved in cell wall biosynthesis